MDLVKTFSPAEIQEFSLFIESPIYNRPNKNGTPSKKGLLLKALWQEIASVLPDNITSPALKKETIFKKLFPDKKKYNSSLTSTMRGLTKLIEEFLLLQRFKKQNATYQQLYLLNELHERQLKKYFESSFKIINQDHQTAKHQGEHHFQNDFFLKKQAYVYGLDYPKFGLKPNIQGVLSSFEVYALLIQLQCWCETLNTSKIWTVSLTPLERADLNSLLARIQYHNWHKTIPAIQWHYCCLYLLLEPDKESHFSRFKQLLTNPEQALPNDELNFIFTIVKNYCNQQHIKGKLSYSGEMLNLYLYQLERGLLYEGPYIPYQHLINIGNLKLKNHESIASVKNFMEAYKFSVAPHYQTGFRHYVTGLLAYHAADYEQAIFEFNTVHGLGVLSQVDAHSLLLKCYYEAVKKEGIAASQDAKSFKKAFRDIDFFKGERRKFGIFINKQNLAKERKSGFINFAKYADYLLKFELAPDTKKRQQKLEKLRQKIETEKVISDRQWLLKKAKALKKQL